MRFKYNLNNPKKFYGIHDLENLAKETKMTILTIFGCVVIGLLGNATSNSFEEYSYISGDPYKKQNIEESQRDESHNSFGLDSLFFNSQPEHFSTDSQPNETIVHKPEYLF